MSAPDTTLSGALPYHRLLSGVPIYGKRGRGYQLPAHVEIPPLMFERREIEALVAGARMVEAWAGPGLAESARSALTKIRGAVPRALAHLDDSRIFIGSFGNRPGLAVFDHVHRAIGENRRMEIHYTGPDGAASERTIRPLAALLLGPRLDPRGLVRNAHGFPQLPPRPDRIEHVRRGLHAGRRDLARSVSDRRPRATGRRKATARASRICTAADRRLTGGPGSPGQPTALE